jgi:hypothetical protein
MFPEPEYCLRQCNIEHGWRYLWRCSHVWYTALPESVLALVDHQQFIFGKHTPFVVLVFSNMWRYIYAC